MEIRLRSTGAVMTESEFRAAHPNTSFPQQLTVELLNGFDADVVLNGPQPSAGRYQIAYRDGVEEIGGKWFTKYSLGPVFTDTIADGVTTTAAEHEAAYKTMKDAEQATSVRTDRNKRLTDSDWTQVIDAPVDQAAWATYRQALRDITEQAGFPWEVEWPDAPENTQ